MQPDAVRRRLDSLPALAVTGRPINGLFRLLASPVIWEMAYESIARNDGDATPGYDGTSLDGFSRERMQSVIDRVMTGTYRFTPARRVYIPKTSGGRRPLGIPNGDAKLVQAAARLILERIYEPVFSERSHGFRVGRSCHTALVEIYNTWKGVAWLVEVDIKSFFDTIDHDRLLSLIARRVDDKQFIRLIRGMLEAGYAEQWVFHRTYSGTPQGGVISPLLANIYLHELDQFMESEIESFECGAKRRAYPEWRRTTRNISYRRERIRMLRARNAALSEIEPYLAEIRELKARQLSLPGQDPMDFGYRRLRYCRYADDFLIGVIGTRADAEQVLAKVTAFIEATGLQVSPEKTRVVKATEGAVFLGYEVRTYNVRAVRKDTRTDRLRATRRMGGAGVVQLHIPVERLRRFAKEHRCGDFGSMRSRSDPRRLHLDGAEIVFAYNAEMRGLANYYALGHDFRQLRRLAYLWRRSLLNTLGHKYKTPSQQIQSRLKQPDGRLRWFYMVNGKSRYVTVWDMKDLNPVPRKSGRVDHKASAAWLTVSRTSLIDRLNAKVCQACGATNTKVEVHHARPLRDLADARPIERAKAGRLRRRVVLCVDCHNKLHAGRLPGFRQ